MADRQQMARPLWHRGILAIFKGIAFSSRYADFRDFLPLLLFFPLFLFFFYSTLWPRTKAAWRRNSWLQYHCFLSPVLRFLRDVFLRRAAYPSSRIGITLKPRICGGGARRTSTRDASPLTCCFKILMRIRVSTLYLPLRRKRNEFKGIFFDLKKKNLSFFFCY